MKVLTFVATVCAVLPGVCSTLFAQTDTIQISVSGDTVRYILFNEDISDQYSYVEVGNYFEAAAAVFTVGEFAVRSGSNPINYINFEHPLAKPRLNAMQPVPVYQNNSQFSVHNFQIYLIDALQISLMTDLCLRIDNRS